MRILLFVLTLSAAQFQGMDMDLIAKWNDAKIIRYHVQGVYSGRTLVVHGDQQGKADVVDKITAEFVWDVNAGKPIGEVKIVEAKSEIKNIKSDGTNCPPPTLKGEYEHFQMIKHSAGPGGQIQLNGVRTFPAAMVSQYPASCDQRAIPGAKVDKVIWIAAIPPMTLGVAVKPGEKGRGVAADKKSFWIKGAEDWIWTYTPTIVR